MKYTINVKGSASIKGKIFPGGEDFTAKQLNCNKTEITNLIKEGVIREAKEAEKVITELEKVTAELDESKKALTEKDTELEKVKAELVKATNALTKAQEEINTLKAK